MTAVRPTSTSGYGLSAESPAETASSQAGLWRAVIDLAFFDATDLDENYSLPRLRDIGARVKRRRDDARSWLLTNRSDFVVVCDLAGRDPQEVRDQARRLLHNPAMVAAYNAAPREGFNRGSKTQNCRLCSGTGMAINAHGLKDACPRCAGFDEAGFAPTHLQHREAAE